MLKKKKKMLKKKTISKKPPVLHRLIRDMTSEAYHGTAGIWSSSQLKVVLEDEELFIQKYIKNMVPREEKESFDTGTYFHTKVLEPHKIEKEIAVFTGKARYGKEWEKFKLSSNGRTAITQKQKSQGDMMAKAVLDSPISTEYIRGEPEVTLFVRLLIADGTIYAPNYLRALTPDGWVSVKKVPAKGFEILVKVRADCLGEDFISDLKSTSGRANKSGSVRGSISKYMYDLSAALYLDIFSLEKPDLERFIWIFASKENPIAAAWAASESQIRVGRAKWMKALLRIADLSKANWEIVDYLREAEPLPHELEWLKVKESDLL